MESSIYAPHENLQAGRTLGSTSPVMLSEAKHLRLLVCAPDSEMIGDSSLRSE